MSFRDGPGRKLKYTSGIHNLPVRIRIRIMANYESEITKFLKDYKAQHPDVEERQREGRGRLWDKPQDAELLEGFRAGRVPQKPYVYSAD